MCGPQVKKIVDIVTSPLNIKEEEPAKEQDANGDSFLSSSNSYLAGGLSSNQIASFSENERTRKEPDDKSVDNTRALLNQDNFDQQNYVSDDLLILSPGSLRALEDRSEKLSDSLFYTCIANAAANTEPSFSKKRTLEDDGLQESESSFSRPKRVKKAITKRNVLYSPSTSSSNSSDDKIDKLSTKKRAGRKKKRKGAPSRPLSAYNFFFKQERMRLKNICSSPNQPKIGFSSMGKIIGTNWKQMSEQAKAPYKALAEKDHERYARELEIFEEKERKAASGKNSPLPATTNVDDILEPYCSSSTSSANSSITQHKDEQQGPQEETIKSSCDDAYTFQDFVIEAIEPIPLNEVWKPSNHGYKAFQNEALYGFNFGDFLNNY